MAIVRLAELQRAWRAQQNGNRRTDLRRYLIDRGASSAATYQLVSRRLYAEGAIDNLGLADHWIDTASESERASLFSDIATALIGGGQ
jgi:hypothetical protein